MLYEQRLRQQLLKMPLKTVTDNLLIAMHVFMKFRQIPTTFLLENQYGNVTGHLANCMWKNGVKHLILNNTKGEISELLVNVPADKGLPLCQVGCLVLLLMFSFGKDISTKYISFNRCGIRFTDIVYQLDCGLLEEKKRAALVARANQAEDEDLGWGDEDLWDIEEQGIDSQPTSKYSVQEDTKDPIPDKSHLTGEQEPVKEISNEPTSEVIKEHVSQSTVTSVKQEKPVVTAATHSGVTASEKLSERNDLDMKDKPTLQESAELVTHRTEQTSQLTPNNQEKSESEHHDPFPAELSKKLTEDTRSGDETADVEPQTTLHKRENSNGSVDSSWSKLSEEELKANGDNKEAGLKEIGAGSGNSSTSSGSGVLVPSVDDKDVEWDDDDDDLEFNEDMSEEEVKKIMQSMAAKNKQQMMVLEMRMMMTGRTGTELRKEEKNIGGLERSERF
ncbi:hypothetical protein OS493_001061 [Desmophyllum pertusum]|uniref:Uncharacterized protein n=1 Tax=Desmophyllum pertusum TaxID=174260 RepID=A0A9X0D6T3_9CNID|nr:hypothetical protein OS493_001061 [Desmophyllum pertusum]